MSSEVFFLYETLHKVFLCIASYFAWSFLNIEYLTYKVERKFRVKSFFFKFLLLHLSNIFLKRR